MAHASGRVTWANQSGGNFAPDRVPDGIDTRGGFILLREEKGRAGAKDTVIDIPFAPDTEIEFDYSDIEGGGDMKAGYYYEVQNLRKVT